MIRDCNGPAYTRKCIDYWDIDFSYLNRKLDDTR
jgi:hypothetical protein